MYDNICRHFLFACLSLLEGNSAVGCKRFLLLRRVSLFFCHSWFANVFMHRINLCTAAHAAEDIFFSLPLRLYLRYAVNPNISDSAALHQLA